MVDLINFYGFLFYLIGIIYLVNLLYKDLNILVRFKFEDG